MKFEVTYTITKTASYSMVFEADSLEEAREDAQQAADDYNCVRWGNGDVIIDAVCDIDSNNGWDTEVTDVTVEQMA